MSTGDFVNSFCKKPKGTIDKIEERNTIGKNIIRRVLEFNQSGILKYILIYPICNYSFNLLISANQLKSVLICVMMWAKEDGVIIDTDNDGIDDRVDRLFTGQMYDKESGLYYMNARYYDPDIGTFMTADLAMSGLNHYAYASCNPIKYTDPTGLMDGANYGLDDQGEVSAFNDASAAWGDSMWGEGWFEARVAEYNQYYHSWQYNVDWGQLKSDVLGKLQCEARNKEQLLEELKIHESKNWSKNGEIKSIDPVNWLNENNWNYTYSLSAVFNGISIYGLAGDHHFGIDLFGVIGDLIPSLTVGSVFKTEDKIVGFSKENPKGNFVIIELTINNVTTYISYQHLLDVFVKEGEQGIKGTSNWYYGKNRIHFWRKSSLPYRLVRSIFYRT